ncbi:SgcJ/EcaC family oxidoreductase [Polymorphobacter sp. PAMC 29334]|uniref:SgcJ/EcaC family oxidoreductase n=1 Tax=Polymorphobacter sp. PAMC 29334 TaxID=2862331 RepID=UPI001C769C35|nr:SgcJ/EcaC family oxidoreductase [Polymorphobacter sp. PAMC 29334]QYE33771.1 SgcJ/EcaC family oxidoreductase [Polymorphobacter sp. PAMC 29334]
MCNPLNKSTLVEVAARYGFRDQAALLRSFRKAFGTTPSKLREHQAVAEPVKTEFPPDQNPTCPRQHRLAEQDGADREGSSVERDVAKLFGELTDAWQAGDADWFAATFADDARFIAFDGTVLPGPKEIAEARQTFDRAWHDRETVF